MPWHLERREGKVCVIKDSDGSTAGCHSSRADAVKQMRALYANESRMASMYAELDEMVEEEARKPSHPLEEKGSELVKIVVGNEQDRALTASVVQAMDGISARLAATEQFNEAVVAALSSLADKETSINVHPPNVTIEPPEINVPQPNVNVEFQPPDVRVEAPNVHVHPKIVIPQAQKTITFERDFDGRITKAEVVEE